MINSQIPNSYNGQPTEYTFFDGFMKGGLLAKVLWIVGFPVLSVVIEGLSYNKAMNNAKLAQAAMTIEQAKALQLPANEVAPAITKIEPEMSTKFQDALREKATISTETQRTT